MRFDRCIPAIGLAAMTLAALAPSNLAAAQRAPVPLGSAFVLAAGETIAIADTVYSVRFDAVTEDSRCPVEVLCVWSGVARITLIVETAEGLASPVTVDTLGGTGATKGLTFSLLGLKPDPHAGVSIAPEDYAGLFRVEIETSAGQVPPALPLVTP